MKTCAGRLLDKVAAFCRQEKLIHPGDHLLIACSGGPDSLTLLDILASLRHAWNLTLTVCYVHHGIRPSADDEVGIVRKAAEERDCGFMWDFADVPRIAAGTHQSLETAGRNERYRILRQCAGRCHVSAIAVAHQQNDQAETVLQHLLRGSGLRGLGGIRPKNGDIIRPLLALTRRDIEDYIKERGLVPCEDETNQSRDYGRNRIRLELIPQLEAYNPAVIADLNRLAVLAGADEDFLASQTEQLASSLVKEDQDGVSIGKRALLSQPLALQRRLIRYLFSCVRQSCHDVPFHFTEAVRQLAAKGAGHCFEGLGLCVYTTKERLCFTRAARGEFKKRQRH